MDFQDTNYQRKQPRKQGNYQKNQQQSGQGNVLTRKSVVTTSADINEFQTTNEGLKAYIKTQGIVGHIMKEMPYTKTFSGSYDTATLVEITSKILLMAPYVRWRIINTENLEDISDLTMYQLGNQYPFRVGFSTINYVKYTDRRGTGCSIPHDNPDAAKGGMMKVKSIIALLGRHQETPFTSSVKYNLYAYLSSRATSAWGNLKSVIESIFGRTKDLQDRIQMEKNEETTLKMMVMQMENEVKLLAMLPEKDFDRKENPQLEDVRNTLEQKKHALNKLTARILDNEVVLKQMIGVTRLKQAVAKMALFDFMLTSVKEEISAPNLEDLMKYIDNAEKELKEHFKIASQVTEISNLRIMNQKQFIEKCCIGEQKYSENFKRCVVMYFNSQQSAPCSANQVSRVFVSMLQFFTKKGELLEGVSLTDMTDACDAKFDFGKYSEDLEKLSITPELAFIDTMLQYKTKGNMDDLNEKKENAKIFKNTVKTAVEGLTQEQAIALKKDCQTRMKKQNQKQKKSLIDVAMSKKLMKYASLKAARDGGLFDGDELGMVNITGMLDLAMKEAITQMRKAQADIISKMKETN